MDQVYRFDVEGLVVLYIFDFPSFFARYPFVDPADESVDGGVVDKI